MSHADKLLPLSVGLLRTQSDKPTPTPKAKGRGKYAPRNNRDKGQGKRIVPYEVVQEIRRLYEKECVPIYKLKLRYPHFSQNYIRRLLSYELRVSR